MNTRRQERTRLIYHLRVFDARRKKLLGHMVDITSEGLMLIGEDTGSRGQEVFVADGPAAQPDDGRPPLPFPPRASGARGMRTGISTAWACGS